MDRFRLAMMDSCQSRIADMLALLKEWQAATGDTIALKASKILPMEYDCRTLKRKPDNWQPEYTLRRFFGSFDED